MNTPACPGFHLSSFHLRLSAALLTGLIIAVAPAEAADYEALRREVLALAELTEPPQVHSAEGFAADGDLKPIFFEGLPYQGRPTRVFAWMGLPKNAGPVNKVPGVVLVQGGGGTAFKEWVRLWNDHGFAAISIATDGQTDQPNPDGGKRGERWQRHEWAGPPRIGIYGDSDQPLADQWMYHAVADTVLANSLLRSLPEVDADKVGVMGISWGGVITSTVIGIDNRFAFAIPTYGCGDLADTENQYGRALGNNELYRQVWDPLVRMQNAKLPTLWLSWTGDEHFSLIAQKHCYAAAPGPHMVALVPNMRHGHGAGWNPPDSYAFAESIVKTDRPWCVQQQVSVDGRQIRVRFRSDKPIDKAVLTSTKDSGFTGDRVWTDTPAEFQQNGEQVTVTATSPVDATAWFVNLRSGDLWASSDLREIRGE